MGTREELQRIKAEAEAKEEKEREERRKEMNAQIDYKVENFSKFVIQYFVEEQIHKCNIKLSLGLLSAKSPFWDIRIITEEYIKIYNSLHSEDEKNYFHVSLKEELEKSGISYEKEFNDGDDFLGSKDTLEVRFSII